MDTAILCSGHCLRPVEMFTEGLPLHWLHWSSRSQLPHPMRKSKPDERLPQGSKYPTSNNDIIISEWPQKSKQPDHSGLLIVSTSLMALIIWLMRSGPERFQRKPLEDHKSLMKQWSSKHGHLPIFGWQCCSHLWSQDLTMVMWLDRTDVARSSGWVELIKP